MKRKLTLLLCVLLFSWCGSLPHTRSEESSLQVDVKVGTGLDNLEVTGVAKKFPESVDTLVGWSHIRGATEPIDVKHIWSYKGIEKSVVTLPVKSSKYRTYTRKSIVGFLGPWTFKVTDMEGRVLAETTFTIEKEKP